MFESLRVFSSMVHLFILCLSDLDAILLPMPVLNFALFLFCFIVLLSFVFSSDSFSVWFVLFDTFLAGLVFSTFQSNRWSYFFKLSSFNPWPCRVRIVIYGRQFQMCDKLESTIWLATLFFFFPLSIFSMCLHIIFVCVLFSIIRCSPSCCLKF